MRLAAEPSPDPGDYEYHHRVRIRFAETDAMGIVHHSRYLPLMEEARVAYLRHIGHPYQSIRDEAIEMAVLEVGLRYRQPLRFDELVDIHLTLAIVDRATFQMAYLLTVEGELRATGVTAHGCINADTGRPTRMPTWLKSRRRAIDAAGGQLVDIGSEAVRVAVAPHAGGRIAQLTVAGRELMIGAGDGPPPDSALSWGSYPMVPWAGRIRHGRFEFGGEVIQLPINFGEHAIHGVGFDTAWDVGSAGDRAIELRLVLPSDGRWPFGGVAHQRIEVVGDDPGVVRCELSVTATERAMPFSAGWHPWFRKPSRLGFNPEAMYRRDDDWIAVDELVAVPDAAWDDCFVNHRPVTATVAGVELELRSDCTDWVVYDMPDHATCIEPQTGPPDSFNIRPRTLAPGETGSAWFEIAIVGIDTPG